MGLGSGEPCATEGDPITMPFLLDEAVRLQEDDYLQEDDQNEVRHFYQRQAAVLLSAARDIAVSIWESEQSRRADNPLLFLADLALPGDLYIDQAAGQITYDRQARLVSGAFKGRFRLPKFDGTFTIVRSAINSGGVFDLTCFGTVGFSGGQLTVPERRPIHFHYAPPNDIGFSGGVKVALDNGMRFGAHLILDDPLYGFGIEARGIRLDLANQVSVLKPTIEAGSFDGLASDLRQAYTDYYGSLSSTLETLVGEVAELPSADASTIGEPPDFEAPQVTLEFDLQGLIKQADGTYLAEDIQTNMVAAGTALYKLYEHELRKYCGLRLGGTNLVAATDTDDFLVVVYLSTESTVYAAS